jgi:hypothetical protein
MIFPVYLEKDTQQLWLLQQAFERKPCGTMTGWVGLIQTIKVTRKTKAGSSVSKSPHKLQK